MKIFNFFRKKPVRKTYKFEVIFSQKEQNKKNIGHGILSKIFYGKSKGEVVQTIKNSNEYNGLSINSIIIIKN